MINTGTISFQITNGICIFVVNLPSFWPILGHLLLGNHDNTEPILRNTLRNFENQHPGTLYQKTYNFLLFSNIDY